MKILHYIPRLQSLQISFEGYLQGMVAALSEKAETHLLVVPRLHVESLNELDDENLLGKLLMTVKEVTKKLGIKSYRTVINTGKDAGQEVFHLHLHILAGRIY